MIRWIDRHLAEIGTAILGFAALGAVCATPREAAKPNVYLPKVNFKMDQHFECAWVAGANTLVCKEAEEAKLRREAACAAE